MRNVRIEVDDSFGVISARCPTNFALGSSYFLKQMAASDIGDSTLPGAMFYTPSHAFASDR